MFMFYRCCGCPALVLDDKGEWCCADYYVWNDYTDAEYRALSDMEEEDCPIPYIRDWDLIPDDGGTDCFECEYWVKDCGCMSHIKGNDCAYL